VAVNKSRNEASEKVKKKGLGLSAKSFLGMGFGLVAGIVFGGSAEVLQPIGTAFIRLLQMTVLPYLVVSLALGICSIESGLLRRMGKYMVFALLTTWGIGITAVYVLGQAFPSNGNSSYYSDPQAGAAATQGSLIDMFIPNNPFASLAEGAVPAVVLFTILIAVQLAHHPQKQKVIDILVPIQQTLIWLTSWINRALPYGVFILTTEAAGTMTVAEFQKLGFFLILNCLGALALTFWLLPMAVSLTTPYRYVRLLRDSWAGVALAIGAGSAFVALPTIMQNLRDMAVQTNGDEDCSDIDEVVPIAFNFPHTGAMFNFLFVLFAASAYGVTMSVWTHLQLILQGLPVLFSGGVFAINFLLTTAGVPSDAVSLFMNVQGIRVRFNAGLAAVSLIVVAIWVHAAMRGTFRIRTIPLAGLFVGTLGTFLALALVVKPFLSHDQSGIDLMLSQEMEVKYVSFIEAAPPDRPATAARDRVEAGEYLTVAYFPQTPPFSYTNTNGQVVGYQVAMAEKLGEDLGIEVRMVPATPEEATALLAAGRIDTIFGAIPLSGRIMRPFDFSPVYLQESIFVLIEDARAREITEVLNSGNASELTFGKPAGLPNVGIRLESLTAAKLIDIQEPVGFVDQGLDGALLDEVTAKALEIKMPMFKALVISREPVLQFAFPILPNNDLGRVMEIWVQKVKNEGFLAQLEARWFDLSSTKEEEVRTPLFNFLPGAAE